MNCPSCNKTVKDGTSICPHCDAVLDESILGAMPAGDGEGGEDTPPPKPAPKKAGASKAPAKASTGKRPAAARKPAPVSAKAAEPAEPEPAKGEGKGGTVMPISEGKYTNKYSQYWTEEEQAKEAKEGVVVEVKQPVVKGVADPELVDPLVTLKNLWGNFLGLQFEDKLTVASAAALIVCDFMPWRSTPDGDDMGLMTHGIYSFLLACLAIATIWARKKSILPVLTSDKYPLVAMGAGALSALVGVVFVFMNIIGNKSVRAGRTVTLFEPSFGVFLAIVCSAGIVIGGLLTFRREKQQK